MTTLALTGATGFVGKATLAQALADGHKLRALTRRPAAKTRGVTWIPGALDDEAALAKLVKGAHAVIHIAGVVGATDRASFEAGNVTGTLAIVLAARRAGVRRFVHVSSLAAREPQLSEYCRSKYRAERIVRASGLDWTMVRPPAVYGPGDTELLDMFRMAQRGFVLLPPKGRTSLIEVGDLARLLLALAEDDSAIGATYEADDGVAGGWSHESFARAIGWAVGRRISTLAAPAAVLRAAARADILVRRGKAKLTPDRAQYLAHSDWVVDPAKRPPAALWQPKVNSRAGLKATAAWYREQGWLT